MKTRYLSMVAGLVLAAGMLVLVPGVASAGQDSVSLSEVCSALSADTVKQFRASPIAAALPQVPAQFNDNNLIATVGRAKLGCSGGGDVSGAAANKKICNNLYVPAIKDLAVKLGAKPDALTSINDANVAQARKTFNCATPAAATTTTTMPTDPATATATTTAPGSTSAAPTTTAPAPSSTPAQVPAGMPAVTNTTGDSDKDGKGDLDCADFPNQATAQAYYDMDPTDPNKLDTDGDGVPCEVLFGADANMDGKVTPDELVKTMPNTTAGVDTGGW